MRLNLYKKQEEEKEIEKRPDPKENQIYKHFKGNIYKILGVAVHTESSEKLVVYKSVENPEKVFARPIEMFMSEIDRFRYPMIRAKYRFTLIEDVSDIAENALKEVDTVEVEIVKETVLDEETKANELIIPEMKTEEQVEIPEGTTSEETTPEEITPEESNEEVSANVEETVEVTVDSTQEVKVEEVADSTPEEKLEEVADSASEETTEANSEAATEANSEATTEETTEANSEETTEAATDDDAKYKEDGTLVIDPIVEAILDEKDFTKKIENFERLRGKCTDEMLTTLAISLDVQVNGDSVEEKYADILKTLRMHEKYETSRLR